MNADSLNTLLKHPEAITASQTDALNTTIKSYPYFQALRALQLKGLKLKESYKYNNALKRTAAYTTDRSILFDYITSRSFHQNDISLQIQKNSEQIKAIALNDIEDLSIQKSVTIDDQLKKHIQATEGVLDPELFEPKVKETHSDVIASEEISPKSPEEQLNIGKPLSFDKSENHSFMEWLKLTRFKPIQREENEGISKLKNNSLLDSPFEKKLDIIDKFISENPKIKPISQNTPKPRLVDNDNQISDQLMTETLARIYLEQKNYNKAIQSYKILSLKYPEKSSFFALQIKAVEDLKANNTL